MYLLQIQKDKKLKKLFKFKLFISKLKLKRLFLQKLKISLKQIKIKLNFLQYYINNKNKESLIKYILNIINLKNNILIYIKNIKGKFCYHVNGKNIDLIEKGKIKKLLLFVNLFKFFLKKFKNLLNNNFNGLHVKNFKNYYNKFILKMFRKKIYLKIFKNYKIEPFNGCRPKK